MYVYVYVCIFMYNPDEKVNIGAFHDAKKKSV